MKFSMVQMAALALALGVSAAPAFEKRDRDEGGPGFGRNSSGGARPTGLRPSSGFGSGSAVPSGFANLNGNGLKAAAASSSAATSTKASKSSAVASSGAAATTKASSTSGSSSDLSGGSLPASSGTSVLSAAQTIAAGDSFDGGMVMFDRGVSCTGQAEGGDSDAVFQIENGGSISNVIIGPNQIEGIHCQGACTLTNVWWSAVCEDAFTVKNQDAGETTKIIGGGAFGADDKVVQHNGAGTISISDFTVDTFGKLYRSCGNCDTMYERHVIMDGITATDGDMLAGINSNYGDSATITNSQATGVDDICVTFTGTDDGSEPTENGSGNDGTYCIYGSDVTSS